MESSLSISKLSSRSSFKKKDASILNLAPMIDILTVLLVFLILTFVSDEKAVNLASGTELPSINAQMKNLPRLHIEVTPTGIAWEGILLPSSRLQEKLKELGFEKEAVLLIADQNLDFQYMDRAIAQLTEAGFTDYYFLTENPDGPIEEVN